MKAGIIGLGRVGYDFGLDKNRPQPASHFHCYQQLGAEIGVCDNDKIKLESVATYNVSKIILPFEEPIKVAEKETNVKYYNDYKEMFVDFKPEIVSVCTPTGTHKDVALAAAECPSVKTIFLEKPIAQSLGEADEIIRACKDSNKRLAVNYSRRWSKNYAHVRKGLFAPTYMVGLHPGPLIRTGTHMIDLFNWFAWSPTPDWDNVEVQAYGGANFASYMGETEDFNVNGYINYGDSKAVLIGNVPPVQQKTVVFELTCWTRDLEFRVSENGCRTEMYGLSESKRYTGLTEYRHCFLSEDEPENLLLNAITELVNTPLVACSGLDARHDLQVALALHYSATHGNKTVKLSEVPYEYTVRSY